MLRKRSCAVEPLPNAQGPSHLTSTVTMHHHAGQFRLPRNPVDTAHSTSKYNRTERRLICEGPLSCFDGAR